MIKKLVSFLSVLILVLLSCGARVAEVKVVEVSNSLPAAEKDSYEYLKNADPDYKVLDSFYSAEKLPLSDGGLPSVYGGRLSSTSPNKEVKAEITKTADSKLSGTIYELKNGKYEEVFTLDQTLMGSFGSDAVMHSKLDKVVVGNELVVFHSNKAQCGPYGRSCYDILIPVVKTNGNWHQGSMLRADNQKDTLSVCYISKDSKTMYSSTLRDGDSIIEIYKYDEKEQNFAKRNVKFIAESAGNGYSLIADSVVVSPSGKYVSFVYKRDSESKNLDEWLLRVYEIYSSSLIFMNEETFFEKHSLDVAGFYDEDKYLLVESSLHKYIYRNDDNYFERIFCLAESGDAVIKNDSYYKFAPGKRSLLKRILTYGFVTDISAPVSEKTGRGYVKIASDGTAAIIENSLYFIVNYKKIRASRNDFIMPFMSDDGTLIVDLVENSKDRSKICIYVRDDNQFNLEEFFVYHDCISELTILEDGSIRMKQGTNDVINKYGATIQIKEGLSATDSSEYCYSLEPKKNAVTIYDIKGKPLYKIPTGIGGDAAVLYFNVNYMLLEGSENGSTSLFLFRKINDKKWSKEKISIVYASAINASIKGDELILTMGNDNVIIFDISKESTTLKVWYEFGKDRNIQSFSRSLGGLVIAMYDAKNNTVDLLNTSPF